MRSLNSSKLDLTGCVAPELCILKARSCHPSSEYIFAAPFDKRLLGGLRDSVVRDLIFGRVPHRLQCERDPSAQQPQPVDHESATLSVSNIEAIREFSDYFETSLETDSRLREGIPDLNLDLELASTTDEDDRTPAPPDGDLQLGTTDQITSFVLPPSPTSSSSSVLSENQNNDMKNKKKPPSEETSVDTSSESSKPGILKSVLKRGSKKLHKKKHRVQFDESLNKFFEADYVILVRDEEYDDECGRCECGNQFCYEGCYYEDEEEEEFEHSVDSPRFDFAAAFDPPSEFVDPVTLSPPDGYKDGCCPQAAHKISTATMTCVDNEGNEGTRNESRDKLRNENNITFDEKSKARDHAAADEDCYVAKKDIRNQGYPFQSNDLNSSSQLAVYDDNTPANNVGAGVQPSYIVETITMTTVTERRIVRESNDQLKMADYNNGILKGGKLWRNQDASASTDTQPYGDTGPKCPTTTVDEDKRSVKFVRGDDFNDDNCDKNENYEKGEFTLTFKMGNRVVPCNSLKPNSAVRQLFPDPRFVNPPSNVSEIECDDNLGKCEGKYLVTEESLRAFNEVNKRSVFATFSGKERYPYKDGNLALNSDDEDIPQNDLVKKTIERNTLRRSLMRYPRGGENRKRAVKKKAEVSLEERIKRLTCDIDEDQTAHAEHFPEPVTALRTSPPGEESHDQTSNPGTAAAKLGEKSTYKKFTDLFRNKAESCSSSGSPNVMEQRYPYYQPVYQTIQPPDLGIDMKLHNNLNVNSGTLIPAKKHPPANSNEARKQFLSSLAPLTACVTGHTEPNYTTRETLKLKLAGDRHSIVSNASTGTEYSLGDIDDALAKPISEKAPQPDVVAGTPSGDELAMFVQQDAGRIERIKKRYSNGGGASTIASAANTVNSTALDDDEHDDYGFSRRPSVRGIKPRFGSTTEILQQIQAQLQPPIMTCPTKAGSHMTWPYYSAEMVDPNNGGGATSPRNTLPALKEEVYEMGKQNTAEYTAKVVWEKGILPPPPPQRGVTLHQQQQQQQQQQSTLKVETGCNNIHMFRLTPAESIGEVAAVPYKCEEDPVAGPRRIAANNIFQMKVSPMAGGQMRLPMNVATVDSQFTAHPIPVGTTSVIRVGHGQQQTFRVPCPVSGPVQVHLLATHHYENPQIRSSQPLHFPPQIVVAKGTQTSSISTTSFYQLQQSQYPITSAAATSSTTTTTEQAKLIQVNYSAAHQSPASGISSLNSSPTRARTHNHLAERGIPEGAASSSSAFVQDCMKPQPVSLAEASNGKSNAAAAMMYGMKV